MYITSNASPLECLGLLGISVLLYIRNEIYDRVIATLFVVMSTVQFVKLLHNTGNICCNIKGKMLYIILLLQTLVLALGLYWYHKNILIKAWAGFYTLLFIGGVLFIFNKDFNEKHEYGQMFSYQCIDVETTILGNLGWFYILGIFVPLFVIEYYNNWKNIAIWILFIRFFCSIVQNSMLQ